MLHDERKYPEPDRFNPDRFLDSSQPDPGLYVFGFGRRACPGSHLAQASLFLSISQTLALFNVKRVRDRRGEEVIPSAEFITGTIRCAWSHAVCGEDSDTSLAATRSLSCAILCQGKALNST